MAGGFGNDARSGGRGGDTFVFAAGFGLDRIADFGGGDRLDFRITLVDVDRAEVGAGDFLF